MIDKVRVGSKKLNLEQFNKARKSVKRVIWGGIKSDFDLRKLLVIKNPIYDGIEEKYLVDLDKNKIEKPGIFPCLVVFEDLNGKREYKEYHLLSDGKSKEVSRK